MERDRPALESGTAASSANHASAGAVALTPELTECLAKSIYDEMDAFDPWPPKVEFEDLEEFDAELYRTVAERTFLRISLMFSARAVTTS